MKKRDKIVLLNISLTGVMLFFLFTLPALYAQEKNLIQVSLTPPQEEKIIEVSFIESLDRDPATSNIQTRWQTKVDTSPRPPSKAVEYFATFLKALAECRNEEAEFKGNGYLHEQ